MTKNSVKNNETRSLLVFVLNSGIRATEYRWLDEIG